VKIKSKTCNQVLALSSAVLLLFSCKSRHLGESGLKVANTEKWSEVATCTLSHNKHQLPFEKFEILSHIDGSVGAQNDSFAATKSSSGKPTPSGYLIRYESRDAKSGSAKTTEIIPTEVEIKKLLSGTESELYFGFYIPGYKKFQVSNSMSQSPEVRNQFKTSVQIVSSANAEVENLPGVDVRSYARCVWNPNYKSDLGFDADKYVHVATCHAVNTFGIVVMHADRLEILALKEPKKPNLAVLYVRKDDLGNVFPILYDRTKGYAGYRRTDEPAPDQNANTFDTYFPVEKFLRSGKPTWSFHVDLDFGTNVVGPSGQNMDDRLDGTIRYEHSTVAIGKARIGSSGHFNSFEDPARFNQNVTMLPKKQKIADESYDLPIKDAVDEAHPDKVVTRNLRVQCHSEDSNIESYLETKK
jgi:hypothetical protein